MKRLTKADILDYAIIALNRIRKGEQTYMQFEVEFSIDRQPLKVRQSVHNLFLTLDAKIDRP